MATAKANDTAVILGRLEEKIDHLSNQVDELKERIYGNGKPGLIIDQEKQSSILSRLLEIAEQNANNIKRLQSETPQKFLVKNWRTILMIGVAFFLIIHSIIPADLSLWSWFSKFFGGG